METVVVLYCWEIKGASNLTVVEDAGVGTEVTKGTNETVLCDPVNVDTPEFIKVEERLDNETEVSADIGGDNT